ncbi:MAG: RluA family pseudouridine synthase [Anaerolineae bacterium]
MRDRVELAYMGDGERVDRFLAAQLPDVSRSQVQRWIEEGLVTVNGAETKASRQLAPGDVVRAESREEALPRLEPVQMDLEIVHEDEDCAVICKPAGLVVHPAAGHRQDTLVNGLLARYPQMADMADSATRRGRRPGIVHRLDKDTSGLVVVAMHEAARRELQRQFRRRSVEKAYLALAHGRLAEAQGRIVGPIGRDPRNRKRMAVVSSGRRAVTEYAVQSYLYTPRGIRLWYSLVEVHLVTGRTHQIRVHFAHLGHAVVGDRTYGRRREHIACPRQFLHAHQLGFHHPRDARWMSFESALPPDLEQVLSQLEAVV